MTGLVQDVRSGLRVLRRSPGFAAVVVLTMGLGVGGATAVFSVVRGVLLQPLPFENPDRVVMLWGHSPTIPRAPLTVGDHNALVEQVAAFSMVAAEWSNNALILGESESEQVSVGWITPDYLDVVGVPPALGRGLEPQEEGAVVLSHGLWARRYGSDPSVIGTTIDLSGDVLEVVGVLPSDRDPNVTTFGGGLARHQVWRLQPPGWTQGDDRSVGWLRSTARLADGVSVTAAQAEVDALMARVNETVTDRDGGTDMRVQLIPVRTDLVGGVARTMWILLGAVVGVLLIAATNIAHLMLARGEGRAAEVAVRAALGGSRVRLFRQFLVESAVLAVAGGALGIVLAAIGVRVLVAIAPPTLPRLDEVSLEWGVFGFALLATLLATAVFAVLPAIRASRTDLAGSMGERSSTSAPRSRRLSHSLVVAEVALSLTLLASTGLLLRSFSELGNVDLGFQKEGIVTFALEAPTWGGDDETAKATMLSYLDQIEAVPGVQMAAFTNRVPLGGGLFTGSFRSTEMVAAEDPALITAVRYVTPNYFEALGATLKAGRVLRADDGLDRALIDETAARRIWPNESAVGRVMELSGGNGDDSALVEVIGVVAPMKHHGVAEAATQTVYLPMLAAANRQNFRYAAVRVSGDPDVYVAPLRQAVRAVNGDAVIARVRTMTDLFEADVAATRFASLLLTIFGVVALVLAAVGLHGVVAYSVRRRAKDIGIRVALGAEHGSLLRDVVRSGAKLVVAGIAVGWVLSLVAGRFLGALLYEIQPHDPLALGSAAVVMFAVGLLGAYMPARLVLAVDPAVTLREE